jgi:hypothetical protein
LLFIRNPRALDTPLPTGVSCRAGVACGAISLRRLPPPVAHVALDFAGFDPARFGMLGKVQQDDDGFTVVLPRQAYRVERGAARPVAIPVTSLSEAPQNVSETRALNRFWVLLSASGTFGVTTKARRSSTAEPFTSGGCPDSATNTPGNAVSISRTAASTTPSSATGSGEKLSGRAKRRKSLVTRLISWASRRIAFRCSPARSGWRSARSA